MDTEKEIQNMVLYEIRLNRKKIDKINDTMLVQHTEMRSEIKIMKRNFKWIGGGAMVVITAISHWAKSKLNL